jgi:hypothetical protein
MQREEAISASFSPDLSGVSRATVWWKCSRGRVEKKGSE